MCWYTLWMLVHPTHLVLSSETLSNEIFCGIWTENLAVCVSTSLAKQMLFHNPMNKKVVGGTHNILVHFVDVSTPNPSGVVI